MMQVDRKRFKQLTKDGNMDPEIGLITDKVTVSKGFKWLDPGQTLNYKGTDLHHSQAWVELLKAVRSILHGKHSSTTVPRAAIAQWQSTHYKITVLGEESEGSWERQKRGQRVIVKLNEKMANYKAMVKSCTNNAATDMIPSKPDRNGNLMTIPLLDTVKYVQKKLRAAQPRPIPVLKADYNLLIELIYDYDMRREEKYWLDETADRKKPEKAPNANIPRPKDKEKDPKEMMDAKRNYAKEHNMDWQKVANALLYKNGGTVKKWAEREAPTEQFTSHNGAAAGGDEAGRQNNGKRCRFYANGHCRKGDKCDWAHLEQHKERQKGMTGHHMGPQEEDRDDPDEDADEEEPIYWYVAPDRSVDYRGSYTHTRRAGKGPT
jgi:hypothetical protein